MSQYRLRDFIVGKEIIPSRSEFKRVMLTGYLALICMAIAVIYSIWDTYNHVYYAWPAYANLFFVPALSLWLIKSKRHMAGKITLMLAANFAAFFAAVSDPFETGAFVYFISVGIGSFAVLEYKDRMVGLALATFTLLLFLVAYFGDVQQWLQTSRPSDTYIKVSFIFNYFFSLTVSVLVFYFLISLNRRSETELIEKEKLANEKNTELQKVNEELDRFVYSVSHDLRSPLSSILGLTDLARRTNDPQELDQILGMIQGRVKAQDHFISEIIDYSRNVRTHVEMEAVNLNVLVEEILDMLKFNSNAGKIEFRRALPPDTLIITDRTRLSVILSNLIGNAIKYHDFNKPVPFIEIGFNLGKIYVQDNGIGILPDHQEKIFSMFYRASDRSTGSGLGLFITKEAVEKLNGKITLHSVYGEGSKFTVTLAAN